MGIREYVKNRIQRFQAKMVVLGLDAVILIKPENTFYFSNFNPVLNSHPCYVLITPDSARLLVHSLRASHAKEEGALDEIYLYGNWGNNAPVAMDPIEAVKILLGDRSMRLGLELDNVSMTLFKKLQDKMQIFSIHDISKEIGLIKMIKDEYEIAMIRRSAGLVDIGVKTAIEFLEQGYSEAEASTEGQYRMRRMWSEQYPDMEVCGFGTSEGGMFDSLHVWILTNGHIAYGCDCPRHICPKPGDISLPMAWAKSNGYHAENERTVLIGEVTGIRDTACKAMLEARQAIYDIMRPGVTFEKLYEVATAVYTAKGFGDILPGRVGHGVGCSGHEYPSLEKGNTIALEPGMVFTVEPGIMDKSWGGARHSDTVLITPNGYECLTKLKSGIIRIHPRTRSH